jgi:hypothetical protein
LDEKNRLKAERAWFLTEEVRRAEPETEQALTRWGKACMFLDPKAGAYGFLTHCPSLMQQEG